MHVILTEKDMGDLQLGFRRTLFNYQVEVPAWVDVIWLNPFPVHDNSTIQYAAYGSFPPGVCNMYTRGTI